MPPKKDFIYFRVAGFILSEGGKNRDMEMIQAKNLARAQGMPVAVENKWLRFDVAYPKMEALTSESNLGEVVDSLKFYGQGNRCIVAWRNGKQEVRRICRLCNELHPATEFTHTFYCSQSQGQESEDFDECLECRNEANEVHGVDRPMRPVVEVRR